MSRESGSQPDRHAEGLIDPWNQEWREGMKKMDGRERRIRRDSVSRADEEARLREERSLRGEQARRTAGRRTHAGEEDDGNEVEKTGTRKVASPDSPFFLCDSLRRIGLRGALPAALQDPGRRGKGGGAGRVGDAPFSHVCPGGSRD
ncbi:unnamed protein product [Arctogadus glacialis]